MASYSRRFKKMLYTSQPLTSAYGTQAHSAIGAVVERCNGGYYIDYCGLGGGTRKRAVDDIRTAHCWSRTKRFFVPIFDAAPPFFST